VRRTLPELVDLALRVKTHCENGPWSPETTARLNVAHDEWSADPRPEVDHMNVYEYSRVHRWVLSWNRRCEVVASALATELQTLGVTRDHLPDRGTNFPTPQPLTDELGEQIVAYLSGKYQAHRDAEMSPSLRFHSQEDRDSIRMDESARAQSYDRARRYIADLLGIVIDAGGPDV
jgi:hypothetical protein